ncbi:putative methyltransferase domain-containing protein [Trichoderma novae-zelandiae]
MHYIRLLRPPKLAGSGGKIRLELVVTINTDLSDSLLAVQDALELVITAEVASSSGKTTWALTGRGELAWKPGMRILKPSLHLPLHFIKALAASSSAEICISAKPALSATGVHSILKDAEDGGGLIMPVWAQLRVNGNGHDDDHLCTRRLYFDGSSQEGDEGFLEIEEELGESMARHVWDGGVVTLCALAGIPASEKCASNQEATMAAMRNILCSAGELNILELGCGVGTLGIGLCAALPQMRPAGSGDATVLLTDLEDAETRTRANISRLRQNARVAGQDAARLLYENLDWEDGRQGRFGPQVQARRWDLVVLSDCTYNEDGLLALVETLSALHASNVSKAKAAGGSSFTTKVFVGTKPRHSSENAVFGLLDRAGWEMRAKQVLPLPVLGSEAQSVEMYLFEKS